MSNPKPNHDTVRRSLLKGKSPAEALSLLDGACSAGAQCLEVQSSPVAKQALGDLLTAVTTAHGTLLNKVNLATALMAVIKALKIDMALVRGALGTYEASVNVVADGDGNIINKAGLPTRAKKPLGTALGNVSVLHQKPGNHPMEGILSWPAAPGATGYVIEVNVTPQNPAGPWVALVPGSGRRRVVKALTPGAQLLARVAATAAGVQSEWTQPIIVTTAN